jgi:hypothetical protein
MQALRFHQSGCLANCSGLLHCEGAHLQLEYQYADNFLGLVKGGVKHVDIPISELDSIDLVDAWYRHPKLILQARRMEAVKDVPGMKQGRVELLLARADVDAARALVDALHKPETATVGLQEL